MIRFAVAAILLASLAPAFAKDPEIPSAWRRADVTVDGVADEWSGHLVPLPGTPLVLGVLNDGSYVYLCIKTSDETARKKILGAGLSIWLDASGKEEHGFGVRFPVGRAGRDPLDLPTGEGDRVTAAKVSVAAAGRDLEILGREEGDLGRMRVSDAKPIEAAIGDQDGALVVELKVPLAFSVSAPHAIESAAGRTISVGLETAPPKVKRSRDGETSGGRGGGSGFGGGRGGRGGGIHGGGGGGGRGGGRGADRTSENETKALGKPLKVWLSVPLAKEEAPKP
jgi:hypothetical protein